MSRISARRASDHSPFFSSITRHLHEVGARGEQHALGLEAVAAGAAGFLLVVLERLRRAGVNHEPDVRPIDPHAERDRRHHDVGVFVQERVLVAMPHVVVEPGVIRDARGRRCSASHAASASTSRRDWQ